MKFQLPTALPLRFSSVFWIRHEVSTTTQPVCINTDVVIDRSSPTGIPINIVTDRNTTCLQPHRAYKISGQVACGTVEKQWTLFEEPATTILLDADAIRFNCIVDKVSAHGIGIILNWDCRASDFGEDFVEILQVQHRSLRPMQHDFVVNYIVDLNLSCTLPMDAFKVGNLISIHGNVVGHDHHQNQWEVHATEIIMIHCQSKRRRSRRQNGLPPATQ
ncbi:hypothetical protein DFH28DRAFT_918206 [Melampsora americana]|nr:hypothetical protein DFH28DRAFT_918206 [Melampsora americana]